jgi:hypothetical protein
MARVRKPRKAVEHPAQLPKDRRPTKRTSQDAADVFAALDAESEEDPET